MDDIISEKSVVDYPLIVSIEGMDIIHEQMKNYVCKIYSNKGNGTGFICKYLNNNKFIKFLITCNHVLDQNDLKKGKTINCSFNDEKLPIKIKIDSSRNIFTSPILDTTIIQIKDEEIYGNCLELDEIIMEKNFIKEMYYKKPIYVLENPDNKIYASFGILDSINKNAIIHKCSTKKGASGSPILSLYNNKVIGIHRGGLTEGDINKGILLNESLSEFIKLINNKNNKNTPKKKNFEKNIRNDSPHSKITELENQKKNFDKISNIGELKYNETKSEFNNQNEEKDYVIVYNN